MVRRSKVESLPRAVKEWLDRILVETNFSGYEFIVEEANRRLEAAGADFRLSKSSINRYGKNFDDRLRALKLASEQARAIVAAAPDDDAAQSEALMRLVQERMFQVLLKAPVDTEAPLNIATAARAAADMQRATVTQKKWVAERKQRFEQIESAVGAGRLTPEEALRRVREELYGG